MAIRKALSNFRKACLVLIPARFCEVAELYIFANEPCQLIIQEIVTELCTLRLNVFRFLQTLTLESIFKKEGIHSRILLKGDLRHKIKGNGRIHLREGEFTMLSTGRTDCRSKRQTI